MTCPIPFYAFIIICLPIQLAAYVSGFDEHFTKCPPFNCGPISNISYPFHLLDRADYCGQPGFEVECDRDGPDANLIMTMESIKYKVKDIAWENQSLSIARMDLLHDLCTDQYIDTPIDRSHFEYVPGGQNATLYYDCKPSLHIHDAHRFPCEITDPTRYVFLLFHVPDLREQQLQPSEGCKHNISVPLLKRHVHQPFSPEVMHEDIAEALGFEVTWKVNMDECRNCTISGGRCGHNSSATCEFNCFCPDCVHLKICPKPGEFPYLTASKSGSKSGLQKCLIVVSMVMGGLVLIIILSFLIKKQQLFSKLYSGHQDIENFIRQYGSLEPKRYSYSEVKRMTNSFKNKLGQGGYGIVYKGMLPNGCIVAVKILKTTKENREEFINEVASISRTSHVNIVTLLGFCFEGKRRALIYEFMANGSLNKFIHDGTDPKLSNAQLGWEKLYQIAIGIARGLEYLHRGCNTRILHFDIKPHNILLNEEFHPKISDFGLAKICLKKESIVSMMIARGTIGYIVPEVFNRNFGGVSPKSDVYSYGMMLLEMTGATKKENVDINDSNQLYFPNWIYECLELGQDLELYGELTSEENEILRKLTLIGLWCIQMKPSERPSISKVIDMLEGSVDTLKIPPKPFFTSPPRVIEGSYSTSNFLIEE